MTPHNFNTPPRKSRTPRATPKDQRSTDSAPLMPGRRVLPPPAWSVKPLKPLGGMGKR